MFYSLNYILEPPLGVEPSYPGYKPGASSQLCFGGLLWYIKESNLILMLFRHALNHQTSSCTIELGVGIEPTNIGFADRDLTIQST